jgi:Tfp pilus assembly protein PilF
VLDALPPAIREKRIATREIFESGIRNFHMKNYDVALQQFKEIVETDKNDACARHYLAITQKRIENPSLAAVFTFDLK